MSHRQGRSSTFSQPNAAQEGANESQNHTESVGSRRSAVRSVLSAASGLVCRTTVDSGQIAESCLASHSCNTLRAKHTYHYSKRYAALATSTLSQECVGALCAVQTNVQIPDGHQGRMLHANDGRNSEMSQQACVETGHQSKAQDASALPLSSCRCTWPQQCFSAQWPACDKRNALGAVDHC